MSCKVVRYGPGAPEGKLPGELRFMTFHCDHDGCDASPSDDEIIANGGMRNMGWDCRGGNHFCPKHRRN